MTAREGKRKAPETTTLIEERSFGRQNVPVESAGPSFTMFTRGGYLI
jgi:hypothetical protein